MIDDAMADIERENTALGNVLPKMYDHIQLDRSIPGQLIDTVGNITAGSGKSRSKDVLWRFCVYFLPQFASGEGKKCGEFHTPPGVVRLPAEMLEPYDGRVYDPCCGSAGMLVQSGELIRRHAAGGGNGGRARGTIRIFGRAKPCRMETGKDEPRDTWNRREDRARRQPSQGSSSRS